jgi:2-keto-4-pentenoate hydratase/2-oxohepta-3-ene-1,7-dioic acid hydratase in catechol pathway
MTVLQRLAAFGIVFCGALLQVPAAAESARYVRYDDGERASYGIQEGNSIRQLSAAPWLGGAPTGERVALDEVRLLAPAEPSKVFAVGYNYLSHRGDRELPAHPPIFLKLPTSIIGPEADVIYPQGGTDLHYEAELVVVIGKRARNVSPEEASDYVFGVTAGNDVSERVWQADDLQWFRGKASDTFGPLGPAIVTGLDYNDLLVQSRLNGKTMQSQRTRDFIHDVEAIVSHISQTATLLPGDIIFTGTPGSTSAMQIGDVIEIEVEGVGVLRNRIAGPDAGN